MPPRPALRGRSTSDRGRAGSVLPLVGGAVAPLVLVLGTLVGCGSSAGDGATTTDPPVDASPTSVAAPPATAPDPVPAPGTLVAADPIDAPEGARAWRTVYASEGVDGPTVVTGMVVVPDGDPPPEGWPVVAWAHPTRGLADACAPSLTDGTASIPLLPQLLAEGWAVVATDYEGLGSPGLHPYLVGSSEGRSILDALRSAPGIEGAGLRPGAPTVLFGFSQGGHGALFAAEAAAVVAPDVDLVGLAVAAPVSDVSGLVRRFSTDPEQVGVVAAIVAGVGAASPGADPALVLTPDAVATLPRADIDCIDELRQRFVGPPGDTIRTPLADDPTWAALLDEQLAGTADPGVPVLVVQGDADTTVDPAETAALVERLDAAGADVTSVVVPGGHGVDVSAQLLPWLRNRLS